MAEPQHIPWTDGAWTTPPDAAHESPAGLAVTAREGSDAWRHTAYGFVHDSEHALLAALGVGEAMEVSFRADWQGQFDQAGLFVRVSAERWIKAGVEFCDGHLGVGAVVTNGHSDWSVGQVDEWLTSAITIRVSRWPDAVIVRARADDGPWRLVRVAPLDGAATASAGPLVAAPTRSGLTVQFTRWVRTPADGDLHP